MIPAAAHQFTDTCAEAFGSRLVAILLEGSFARGDEHDDSDIDLFVLLDEVDRCVLDQVGSIVDRIEAMNEINPSLVSLPEITSHPALFDYLRIKHDGVVLYGALPELDCSQISELGIARRIAHEVLMSARHYLAVSEPEVNFAGGKLYNWNLKPLGFALRFFHLDQTGEYIRSVRDLAGLYPVLALDPAKDWERIIQECISTCEMIIRTD